MQMYARCTDDAATPSFLNRFLIKFAKSGRAKLGTLHVLLRILRILLH